MDWNSEIQDQNYEIEPGVYPYEIEDVEQTESKGGTLPSSPMLKVKLVISLKGGGSFHVTDYIVLHESLEWKVAQFLESIGQKEPGKPCKPNWRPLALIGAQGKVKITNRKQEDGRSFPRVARWLPKDGDSHKESFFGDEFKPVDDSNIPF